MSETQVQVKTSNPETQFEIQELTPEKIKELVEKAEKEGRLEGRYLLKLSTWYRQGSSYEDKASYEVILGEIDSVETRQWDEGYPYRRGVDTLIIPKTLPVIIVWRHKWDYGEDRGEREIVYVFTTEGWKSIRVK
jgi:hypothetical protein